MKKIMTLAIAILFLFTGCEVDTSEIDGRIDNLEGRVAKLEQLCSELNSNISSLQKIVTALQNNDYVTGIKEVTKDGETIGYTISFTKSGDVTIYHGKDGQDGKNGENGKDGQDGKNGENGKDGRDGKDGENGKDGHDGKNGIDGKDGHTPIVGVAKGDDGIYYWTLDGEWLLDKDGNKIKAEGRDGKDGQDGKDGVDGQDGKDGADGQDGKNGKDGENGKDGRDGKDGNDGENGITPELKIEDGYWYISYDGGISWDRLYKAVGEDGKDGKDGLDGKDGKDGDSFFKSVTYDENNVYITLADGTELVIPIASESFVQNIQSIKYVPKYTDGVTEVVKGPNDEYGLAEFEFRIYPGSLVEKFQESWKTTLKMQAFYTEKRSTKAADFIDMPVISFKSDKETGTVVFKASGENLKEDFYKGTCEANAYMVISDGDRTITSDNIVIVPKVTTEIPEVPEEDIMEIVANGIKFNMIKVHGGTFTMGATPEQGTDSQKDALPIHEVTLSDYYISQFEVTQDLWKAVTGANPSHFSADGQNPVEKISWNDVVNVFLPKLNALTGKTFTLPTEAQWEYSARGGNKSINYKYSGSNEIDKVAWYDQNSSSATHGPVSSQVGKKQPNALGLCDMSGNVKELCRDNFVVYTPEAQIDPLSLELGSNNVVLRGGSFEDKAGNCRVSFRTSVGKSEKSATTGLRLAYCTEMTVEDEKLNFSAEGGLGNVNFSMVNPIDGVEPVVECPADWVTDITVKKTPVPNHGSISFAVPLNSVEESRECIMTVSYPGLAKVYTISIQQQAAVPEVDSRIFNVNGVELEMVRVEGGTFTMGGTSEQGSDIQTNEKPEHEVTLSDYYIGRFEVSQKLWKAVMGSDPVIRTDRPENPVENVSWNDVFAGFLSKMEEFTGLKFSLPTEAQWEYAARGGNRSKGYKYSGADDIDQIAWYDGNSSSATHGPLSYPVGQKQPNELGLYDMSGNVQEWCFDKYGKYYAKPQTDPSGSDYGGTRVLRGGSYNSPAADCRVSSRNDDQQTNRMDTYGFRLALVYCSDLTLSTEEISVPVEGGSYQVEYTVDNPSEEFKCSAYCSADWVENLDVQVGKVPGQGRITFSIPSNNLYDSRECIVTVRCASHERQIRIVQESAMPELPAGSKIINVNGVEFTMVKVDGGTFEMGATPDQGSDVSSDSRPVHEVTLSDYYIGQMEVTSELWEKVTGESCGEGKLPVEKVSIYDINNKFIKKLNKMTNLDFILPTEAQWEYAARGGNKSNKYQYSGGDDIDKIAWYKDNSGGGLHPVGTKYPNELCIYDMSGNVSEFCSDQYADYTSEPQTDPVVPVNDYYKPFVCRGGNIDSPAKFGLASFRSSVPSHNQKVSATGFRLALPVFTVKDLAVFVPFSGGNKEVRYSFADSRLVKKPQILIYADWVKVASVGNGTINLTVSPNNNECIRECSVYVSTDNSKTYEVKISQGPGCSAPASSIESFNVNGVEFNMIKVDGGTFQMGATSEQGDDAVSNEYPVHKVTLSDYSIGQMEVTRELWKAVMGDYPDKNLSSSADEKAAASWVSYYDICNEFLPKLNSLTGRTFVLPTEAQWEFAARGGNKSKHYKYSGGNDPDDVGWYLDNTWKTFDYDHFSYKPVVGMKYPNELGIYDMSGSVFEYCADYYEESYSGGDQTNPVGPAGYTLSVSTGGNRVLRGGGNSSDASCMRVSYRNYYRSDQSSGPSNGFRLALLPEEPEFKEFTVSYKSQTATFRMIRVQGGAFDMGSSDGEADESPQHTVVLSDYYIGEFEVTTLLYQTVTGHILKPHQSETTPMPQLSMNNISSFLNKLKEATGVEFSLPTEAQWEFAARGGLYSRGFEYSGSDNLDEVGYYKDNSGNATQAFRTGHKLPNELGLYDMSGNVWERCKDYYDPEYYINYFNNNDGKDPQGPATGTENVIRGGSFRDASSECRIVNRDKIKCDSFAHYIGFRIVCK